MGSKSLDPPNSPRPQRHRHVNPWDEHARDYDERFGETPLTRYTRWYSLRRLRRLFPPSSRVLEFGCGTGEEAVALARHGVHVVAVDPSREMVTAARRKASRGKYEGSVKFFRGDLNWVVQEFYQAHNERTLDGVFSSLGPLNCGVSLDLFARLVAGLVKPGGVVVASVINRVCLFEILYFLCRGDLKSATRRLGRNPIPVTLREGSPPTWVRYYTPRQFYRPFRSYFRKKALEALPLFIPTPLLEVPPPNWSKQVRGMVILGHRVQHIAPFNRWGDHFLMVLERRG